MVVERNTGSGEVKTRWGRKIQTNNKTNKLEKKGITKSKVVTRYEITRNLDKRGLEEGSNDLALGWRPRGSRQRNWTSSDGMKFLFVAYIAN